MIDFTSEVIWLWVFFEGKFGILDWVAPRTIRTFGVFLLLFSVLTACVLQGICLFHLFYNVLANTVYLVLLLISSRMCTFIPLKEFIPLKWSWFWERWRGFGCWKQLLQSRQGYQGYCQDHTDRNIKQTGRNKPSPKPHPTFKATPIVPYWKPSNRRKTLLTETQDQHQRAMNLELRDPSSVTSTAPHLNNFSVLLTSPHLEETLRIIFLFIPSPPSSPYFWDILDWDWDCLGQESYQNVPSSISVKIMNNYSIIYSHIIIVH